MQIKLPARPSLEQLKAQAKELVRGHQSRQPDSLFLIREFLPSLSGKSDREIILYPFALHDAQSVVARRYGFLSWNQLREHVDSLSGRPVPDASTQEKFDIIRRAQQNKDYALFCSVMNDKMVAAVSEGQFRRVSEQAAPYLSSESNLWYMGYMIQGEHAIHFWRVSAPGQQSDLMVRMGVKENLVSGLLLTPPFETTFRGDRA